MKPIQMPPIAERERLMQTPTEALVEIILRQQEIIQQLVEEVERLKTKASSDSRSSSSPPSSDIHKRSEQGKPEASEGQEGKRKPGGQPGHAGKTRKGFGRVERYEVVRPQACPACGGTEFVPTPVRVRRYQVAELVERAIEVVEYEQQCCNCETCGTEVWGQLPQEVVGEPSLGARLQALLVWLGNYGHLSSEKQQELLLELGQIGVGTGTLQATNARLSKVVTAAVEQLGDWVKQRPQVQVDETPWLGLAALKNGCGWSAARGFACFMLGIPVREQS